jgi:hypothetical protein
MAQPNDGRFNKGNGTNTLIMRPPNLMGTVPQAPATRHMKSTFQHLIYLININIQSLLLEKENHQMHQERTDQASTMRIPTNKQGSCTKHLMMRPPNLMGRMLEAPVTHHMKFTCHRLIYLVHINMQSLLLELQTHHRMHQERTEKASTMRIPTNKQGSRTKHLIIRPPSLMGWLGLSDMEILVGTRTKQRNLRIMFTIRFPARRRAMSQLQRRTISNAIQHHEALNYIHICTKFLICIPKSLLARMKVLDHRSILPADFLLRDSHIQRISNTREIVTIQPSLATSTPGLWGVDGEPTTSTCHVYKARFTSYENKSAPLPSSEAIITTLC